MLAGNGYRLSPGFSLRVFPADWFACCFSLLSVVVFLIAAVIVFIVVTICRVGSADQFGD